jgi:hypothetical protein
VRFENKNILFYCEKRSSIRTTTLALCCKFKSCKIDPRGQSFDFELQRRRCKKFTAHGAFLELKFFAHIKSSSLPQRWRVVMNLKVVKGRRLPPTSEVVEL